MTKTTTATTTTSNGSTYEILIHHNWLNGTVTCMDDGRSYAFAADDAETIDEAIAEAADWCEWHSVHGNEHLLHEVAPEPIDVRDEDEPEPIDVRDEDEPEPIDVRDEDETEKMHRRSRADHLRDEVARHEKDIADASAIRSETLKELAELAASEDADYQSIRALADRIARCDNRIEVATAYRDEAMEELNGSEDDAAESESTGLSELPMRDLLSGEHPTAAEFSSIFPFIPLSHCRFLDKGGNHIDSALHQDAEVLRLEHEHGTDMVYVTLDVEPEAEFVIEDFEVVSRDEILAMDCNYNIEGERAYRLLRGTDSCIICYAQEHWIGEYIHWYYDANGEKVEDYLEDFFGDAPYEVCDEASAYAVKVAELIKAEGRD